jgi:hypothetical protein
MLQLLFEPALNLPLLKEAHETFFALSSLCQLCDHLLDRRAMLQKINITAFILYRGFTEPLGLG